MVPFTDDSIKEQIHKYIKNKNVMSKKSNWESSSM